MWLWSTSSTGWYMGQPKFIYRHICAALVAAVAFGCSSHEDIRPDRRDDGVRPPNNVPSTPAAAPRIVFLGDSLTAGLGLPVDEAYPALLQRRLTLQGMHYEVVNAGVSGDTSAGGLSRLDWSLDGNVKILVVALGGNDGLRGLAPAELSRNLSEIIERAQARHIQVVLAGMEAPPNFGREYAREFHEVFPALAKKYHVPLVPFLLDGVAGVDDLNQRDHLHPNFRGAQIVADNVWAVLGPAVQRLNPRD
jgi:acyl-CoA thioesterase-1